MGVSGAAYHHDDRSVAGEMIILGIQRTGRAVLEIRCDKEGMCVTKGCRDKSIAEIDGWWSTHGKTIITIVKCKDEGKIAH